MSPVNVVINDVCFQELVIKYEDVVKQRKKRSTPNDDDSAPEDEALDKTITVAYKVKTRGSKKKDLDSDSDGEVEALA